ncbi:MAG: polysaccharide deacetylase family protein [Magnetococcales bacterium]|nr:polysaccharide deacetylase family protein [Magnetococcales bacterium]
MAYGIMFHHFHNDFHPVGQGSLAAAQLEEMLENLQQKQTILPADEWLQRVIEGTLQADHRCLTFDDALLCQYEVALPVLQRRGLTAFWFVYSSVFFGNREWLEIYRHFRSVAFASVDHFYQAFFAATLRLLPQWQERLSSPQASGHLADFAFYSQNDRIFRYLRDELLTTALYDQLMQQLMQQQGYDPAQAARHLWMCDEQLLDLQQQGHLIGLHSFSHPTRLDRLPAAAQQQEYQRNFTHLTHLLGQSPRSMAHPCNAYNQDTLRLLREMGIQLGFRSNRLALPDRTSLEWPREDHIHLLPTAAPAA